MNTKLFVSLASSGVTPPVACGESENQSRVLSAETGVPAPATQMPAPTDSMGN